MNFAQMLNSFIATKPPRPWRSLSKQEKRDEAFDRYKEALTGKQRTTRQLAELFSGHPRGIRKYVTRLEKAGLIRRTGTIQECKHGNRSAVWTWKE